jgi:hypothetical protein
VSALNISGLVHHGASEVNTVWNYEIYVYVYFAGI